MDEIVRLVAERTGIGEDQARTAVETVVGYIKEKLPAPIAGQVDNALGSSGAAGAVGNVADKLGGMFS
jgi:hypothetical protein